MFLLPASVYISHIFTWFPPHPKLGEFLSWPPQHPASQVGLEREQAEAAGNQAEGSQGTAYFYSWSKNISNFVKFRLFVARRAGPRGERGALLGGGQSAAGQKPLPRDYVVGAQTPPAWPGTESQLG